MSTGELVSLDVPARPAFVGVARSVVASVVATVDGIDDDRMEDLRLAVSEACTNAIGDASGRVVLTCSRTPSQLEVRVEGPADGTDAGVESGWGLQLISALVDDVSFDPTPTGAAVTLRMNLED